MKRLLAPLVLILVALLPASSFDAPRAAATPPRAARVYSVFATDGYVTTPDGESLHFYGLVGGQVGTPLQYRDSAGQVQTLAGGPPLPATGPVTADEAALVGKAQWPAPLIWAASGDVVEVHLKNLGGSAADSPLDPLGLELRGLGVLSVEDAPPESSRLAAPPDGEDPGSGNVVVYLFSPPRAGTFAYGWSVDDHAGHDSHDTASTDGSHDHTSGDVSADASSAGASSGSDAAMAHAEGTTASDEDIDCGCTCSMDGHDSTGDAASHDHGSTGGSTADGSAGDAASHDHGSTTEEAATQSTVPDEIPLALDGALIVFNPGDAAARTGPGTGAAGALADQAFDRDLVVVLPGRIPGPSGLPAYAGPDADAGLPAGLPAHQPQYQTPVTGTVPTGGRVLVRTINPGPDPQSVDMRSYRFNVAGYRRGPLEWSISRMDAPSWLPATSLSRQEDGSVLIEAGEAYDWLLVAPEALQ